MYLRQMEIKTAHDEVVASELLTIDLAAWKEVERLSAERQERLYLYAQGKCLGAVLSPNKQEV